MDLGELRNTDEDGLRSAQVVKRASPSLIGAILNTLSPWNTILGVAQSACLGVLKRIKTGRIRVILKNGQATWYGEPEAAPDAKVKPMEATVKVLNDSFWPRLMLYSALGFGEAYMHHEIEVDALATLLLIFVANRDHMAEMNLLPAGLNRVINAALHSQIPNTIYNSLFNIQAHYDLGNEMFSSFLDETMTYSCPIWKQVAAGESDTEESLEEAQLRKIHSILEMAKIEEGDHVLEVGTGWGALSIEAVKKYKCKVTTLTLSSEQKALAEERIAAAGLSSHINVLLQDYRSLDPREHRFDRIVTVEMLEAVGPEFLPVFFKQADALLCPRRGILSLQVITMPDARYQNYLRKMDFIQKHIFPGGHCPSVTALTDAVFTGSGGRLVMDELKNIGPHYARALRIWRERFSARFDDVVAETGLADVYTDEFRRKWEFYFAYCEAGFASGTLGDVQVRLQRERIVPDGVPM